MENFNEQGESDYPKEDWIGQTYTYGIISNGSGNFFNDYKKLKGTKSDYSVSSVRIYLEKVEEKDVFHGIQFIYKKRGENELIEGGNNKISRNLVFDELKLDQDEKIIGFHIKHDKYINRIGFRTNKRKEIIWYGDDGGNDMALDLENEGVSIFAPFGHLGTQRVEALGMFYIIEKEYKIELYRRVKPLYLLRKHIKDMNNKKSGSWEEEEKKLNLDEPNKYIARTCQLPDLMFNKILGYLMS